MLRREAYGPKVPAQVAVLTCGIDVQDDRLELEVVGWGRDEESWSIDYRVLWGDPSGPDLWTELDAYLDGRFAHETLADGLRLEAACLDTGGHHTLAAYAFCRGKERRRIWAIKGGSGKRPIWPKRPSRANKGKVNLFTLGVDAAKEALFARLKKAPPGAGTLHFPLDRDAPYFEQLTAERKRTRYVKGFAQPFWWKPDNRRNEALDCRVYAMAGLYGLIAMGLALNKRVDALPAAPERQDQDHQRRDQCDCTTHDADTAPPPCHPLEVSVTVDLAQLIAQRDALQSARYSGALQIRAGDKWISYKSDAELRRALADIEQQIAKAQGRRRSSLIRTTASKGL